MPSLNDIITDGTAKFKVVKKATSKDISDLNEMLASKVSSDDIIENASTANTHTVLSDVPANAEFTDTTYSVFQDASSSANGTSGLVPQATASDENKFLKADGTWQYVQHAEQLPVPSRSNILTYDASVKAPTWNNYDTNKLTISDGTTSAIDAGTYTTTFSLRPGYRWSDDTFADKDVTWTIEKAVISVVPSQANSLTYNTSLQEPAWNDYATSQLEISGDTSATNAGTYTAIFTPTSNYKWNDNAPSKSVDWAIAKAANAITLSSNSVELTTNELSDEVTVTRFGTGIITAESSDTDVATASVSDNVITITAVNNGTCMVTVNVATDTNYLASTTSINVSATLLSDWIGLMLVETGGGYGLWHYLDGGNTAEFDPVLENNTWEQIKKAAETGIAATIWSVGDTKSVVLNGTVGILTFNNETYDAQILGFDHNERAEGKGLIHFAIGKKNGTDIAFVDSLYNTNNGTDRFKMNLTNTNVGGWDSSYMKNTICTQFKNVLPNDLKNVIARVVKYTDNTGGGSDTASYVTPTTDDIFLLSEYEVQGARSRANSAEQNKQVQYAYYTNGASKIRYKHSDASSAVNWWLRSVSYNSGSGFCNVYHDGRADSSYAGYSIGFVPCFCVGNDRIFEYDPILNNNSWEQISEVAQSGLAPFMWSIGDCKEITLNGNVGDYLTLTNEKLCVFILDFNHPTNGIAENNIIFGGFKTALTDGVDVALVDSRYDSSPTSGTITFNMNHSWQTKSEQPGYYGTTYGGWKGTDLRYDILGATSAAPSMYNQLKSTSNVGYDATAETLTNPKVNTLLAALPSDLRSNMRLWTRHVDAVGNSSNVDANIKATVDAITLLNEPEIFAPGSCANQYEQNHNVRMAYYTNSNSTIKKKHSDGSTGVKWWESSPFYGGGDGDVGGSMGVYCFCHVNSYGNLSATDAYYSFALAPAFKI